MEDKTTKGKNEAEEEGTCPINIYEQYFFLSLEKLVS